MIVTGASRTWEWPDADVKCLAVVFEQLSSLRKACRGLKGTRTAIQAGGNMGVFPWKLAQKFTRVVTAEPDPICFPYLDRNVQVGNVTKLNAAFADKPGRVSMVYTKPNNLGAQFIGPGNDVPVITIDSLGITDCDLIYLDIEGAEGLALKGAAATIAMSRPRVVIEDKGLSERYGTLAGDAGKWLATNFGYKETGRSHRDVFYTCD